MNMDLIMKVNYWMPVDQYIGVEHAILHLLYSDFVKAIGFKKSEI